MIFLRTMKWLEEMKNAKQSIDEQEHMESVLRKGATYPEEGISISSDYVLHVKNSKGDPAQIPSSRGYSIHASGSMYDLDQLIQQSTPDHFEQDIEY